MNKIVALAVLVVTIVLLGPLISIWALNTLFSLGIAYTFWTWLAMAWVGAVLSAKIGQKSS